MAFPSSIDAVLAGHLLRLLIAGGLSVFIGLALVWRKPVLRSFGLMNAAWGAIDILIAGAGLREPKVSPEKTEGFVRFLILNIGLNCGYLAVGITMMALAGPRSGIKQSGAAVAVQGAVLLALDGYLFSLI